MSGVKSIIKTATLAMVLLVPFLGSAQTNSINLGWFPSLRAPTNGYYSAGEKTIEIAPTITSANIFNNSTHSYGISIEAEYWESATTGTGIEIGTYDIRGTSGFIDHIAIMQDYRIVCWAGVPILDKIALVAKSGAEQYFVDRTKDFEIGLGVDYNLFVRQLRIETSLLQHFRTDSKKDGTTFRLGIQYVF
jgi:hypothetical protein